jgi:hypothetical protein
MKDIKVIKVSITDNNLIRISIGNEDVILEDPLVRELIDELINKQCTAKAMRAGWIAIS